MTYFIYGLAPDHTQVQQVMTALSEIGIPSDRVSILAAQRGVSHRLAVETHAHAAHGSFSGGNVGGGIGWLVGLTALTIPGIGLFAAAGPILGFLAGIAVGRSLGNIAGGMIEEMGIPDGEVARYHHALMTGQVLLSVPCHEERDREPIIAVMRQVGLQDVASTPKEISQT